MTTLADVRKAKEGGATLRDLGAVPVGSVFGKEADVKHRRNSGRRIPRGVLGAVSNTAVNPTEHSSWVLRQRRSQLKHMLQAAEWDWEKNPTIAGADACAALRAGISGLERRLVELQSHV